MPHIHKLIDFTVSCYIVCDSKVLLVHHKKLDKWLPPGGHIELDEDSDEALYREIKEETGLEVEVEATRPDVADDRAKPPKGLLRPEYMDIHQIDNNHRHQNMVFFGKSKNDVAVLESREHNELHWFSKDELSEEKYGIMPGVSFYAEQALNKLA